jgi:triacylglycerol lipase
MTASPASNPLIQQADIAPFDSNYEEFDSSMAQELIGLIQKAYQQFEKRVTPQLSNAYELKKELDGDKLIFGKDDPPFGFVAYKADSKNVFVVFRGTKTFAEWFKDALIPLVSYSNGKNLENKIWMVDQDSLNEFTSEKVTSPISINEVGDFGRVTLGFRQIYISLRREMLKALNSCPKDSHIFVTGHSLGGALATLAIPDILQNTHFNKPEQVTLYTFASPRCGDREFALKFRDKGVRHWRIANTEDFVTMIPFPTGNIFRSTSEQRLDPGVKEPGIGDDGVSGEKKNPNPLFGFFKEMYDRRKRRMPDYVHTGTPVYFTIHEASLERHHNLEEIYMRGISRFNNSQ